ncbi:MAG: NAD(+)/NADH kinase [Ilumatobacteraceae bacterium]|nr:NAD(+)/NADH kinase [Ilumatobacteraceae bacterium]
MTARKIAVVFHHRRPNAVRLAGDIAAWAHSAGCSVCCDEADVDAINQGGTIPVVGSSSWRDADLLVSVGGDGTMLRAIHSLGGTLVPVIGVNVGLLGYLTHVEPEAVLAALDQWLNGVEGSSFHYDDRMLLRVSVQNGSKTQSWLALNEVVFEKKQSGHTVRLGVDIDGTHFVTYSADGLIIATPTGSTAYALSARGPVLSPRLQALLMTPVSPHMMFDRSLVLDPREEVVVEVMGQRPVEIAIDGVAVHTLLAGDRVSVQAAPEQARLIRFNDDRFHQILRSKFGLADR